MAGGWRPEVDGKLTKAVSANGAFAALGFQGKPKPMSK